MNKSSSGYEAIILAGGLGTRLRDVIGQVPKAMAPVNDKPFLYFLLQYLHQQGVRRIVFSLGFKNEIIREWLAEEQPDFEIDWVVEETPLGTGGGIRLALQACKSEQVFVFNGDTMFMVDLNAFSKMHETKNAETSLALKPMLHAERYGTVKINEEFQIASFEEKAFAKQGLINGGIYLINRLQFLEYSLPDIFSFETDYLQQYVGQGLFYGFVSNAYFIDIGIPQDYNQAQTDFQQLFPL